ncbi:MAG: HAD family hydrolase [Lachnospiraceae bacterium]|nr:HAD family hydrolase [Lachnospiraceae bacterium]
MKEKYETILFDLDGTLTDSGLGIVNGFEYAIQKMGGIVSDKSQLRKFVGPPLEDSFGNVLGYTQEETEKAIVFYKQYYLKKGVYENEVYPGIKELLKELKEQGKKLAVATSKSIRGTTIVLEHFGLRQYFDVVATSSEERPTKLDVIRHALSECGISDLSHVLMVGDRKYDITVAKEIGIDCAGVLWGYGDREELENAGATFLVEKPENILF